jgi:thiamine pyrophosphokinase
MRTLIIAASPSNNTTDLPNLAAGADLVVAADGGAAIALIHGVRPDLVVGDMDSVAREVLDALEKDAVELVHFPSHKDETDLELALLEAVQRGADDITIVGALGGRLDHTLGNIYLLTMPELKGRRVRLVDGDEEVFVIRDEAEWRGRAGDTVSLIPLTPEAAGIETRGLEYPLRGESLIMGPGRGISNRMVGDGAGVSVADGILLAVVTHQEEPCDDRTRAV